MTYTSEALFLVSLLALVREKSHRMSRYASNIRNCKRISEAPADFLLAGRAIREPLLIDGVVKVPRVQVMGEVPRP